MSSPIQWRSDESNTGPGWQMLGKNWQNRIANYQFGLAISGYFMVYLMVCMVILWLCRTCFLKKKRRRIKCPLLWWPVIAAWSFPGSALAAGNPQPPQAPWPQQSWWCEAERTFDASEAAHQVSTLQQAKTPSGRMVARSAEKWFWAENWRNYHFLRQVRSVAPVHDRMAKVQFKVSEC